MILLIFSFNSGTDARLPAAALHDEVVLRGLERPASCATRSCARSRSGSARASWRPCIGILAAYPLARRRFRGRNAITAFSLVPLVVPPDRRRRGAADALPQGPAPDPALALDGARRPRRDLAAVLHPAARAAHREHRRAARGGRAGSRRVVGDDVPAHHPAADHAGDPLVVPDRVRRLDRRVRDLELPGRQQRDLSRLPLRPDPPGRAPAADDPGGDRHAGRLVRAS